MTNPQAPDPADVSRHAITVTWSPEDREYVAACAEFPSLSWLASSRAEAVRGLESLLSSVTGDMQEQGEEMPQAPAPADVQAALTQLDGTAASAITLITGVPAGRFDQYGGMPTGPRIEFREKGAVTAIWINDRHVLQRPHITSDGAAALDAVVDVLEALGHHPVRHVELEPPIAPQPPEKPMPKYATLADLNAAIRDNQLDADAFTLIIDNDHVTAYLNGTTDTYDDPEPLLRVYPGDLLRQMLDALGIHHEGA